MPQAEIVADIFQVMKQINEEFVCCKLYREDWDSSSLNKEDFHAVKTS